MLSAGIFGALNSTLHTCFSENSDADFINTRIEYIYTFNNLGKLVLSKLGIN